MDCTADITGIKRECQGSGGIVSIEILPLNTGPRNVSEMTHELRFGKITFTCEYSSIKLPNE